MARKLNQPITWYLRFIRQNRMAVVFFGVLYLLFLLIFFGYREISGSFASRRYETERRIMTLERRIEEQKAVIDSFVGSRGLPTIFRQIHFEENWQDTSKRAEVQRLSDYAHFAISKADYARAKTLFEEAESVQQTVEAEYYLGLLSYVQRDLNSCTTRWSSLVEKDKDAQFPDLRFYLAVVLYEAGDSKRSLAYLAEYVNIVRRNPRGTSSEKPEQQ